MTRTWIIICLAISCSALIVCFSLFYPVDSKIYLVNDAFDPLADLLEPYAEDNMETLSPYRLAHKIPGFGGIAFVYGTQARFFTRDDSLLQYTPLFSAEIVIAVNQNGRVAGKIDGWHSLLNSDAVVLIPDNGTESGRLAAIAMARSLGAREGDLAPALQAYRQLAEQNRLNPRDEYASEAYRNMYQPHRPAEFDAVIMWDYQARKLNHDTGHWDIIVPLDGALVVDCGYVLGRSTGAQDNLGHLLDYLASEQVFQDLGAAGFSPLADSPDLGVWDQARLLYNPQFRRIVRHVKLYAPASVRERLLLNSITFLLFCMATQQIIRRLPRGLQRSISTIALLFVLLWMLTGIMKTIALHPDLMRFFWFASYLPRHGLPVAWLCMCQVHVFKHLPAKKTLVLLSVVAALLTLFVLTNDLHRQVFIYAGAESSTWEHIYSNGWGFYLSLFWSFSLSIIGVSILFREKATRQQKRQYLYAGIFLLLLAAYQLLYLIGIVRVIDLDIPTTVSIFIMVFILAAQRERFMGALLLALPTFQHMPHAIAVYDREGRLSFSNQVMKQIDHNNPSLSEHQQTTEVQSGDMVFQTHVYPLKSGKVMIYEDITELKKMERMLADTHNKLKAVHNLLLHQAEERPARVAYMEQERYLRQIDLLFKAKLADAQREISQLSGDCPDHDQAALCKARFLISICQQRLRLIIGSLEQYPQRPLTLVIKYAQGLSKNGLQVGLDSVFSTDCDDGEFDEEGLPRLLDTIDTIFLYTLDLPNTSLIVRLERYDATMKVIASFSQEEEAVFSQNASSMNPLLVSIAQTSDHTEHKFAPDGLTIRLSFSNKGEAAT